MTEDTGWPPPEPEDAPAEVPAAEPEAAQEAPAEEPAPVEQSAPEEPGEDPLLADVPASPAGLRHALAEILRRLGNVEHQSHAHE